MTRPSPWRQKSCSSSLPVHGAGRLGRGAAGGGGGRRGAAPLVDQKGLPDQLGPRGRLQHDRAGAGRGHHGAGAAALRLAGLPRVRGHAGAVRGHRRVLRLLRARPARRGRVPDGRPQDAGAAHLAVPGRELHLRHHPAGPPHRGVRVRGAALLRLRGNAHVAGRLQLGSAAHLPRPAAHDALPVFADAVRPSSPAVRLGFLHHFSVDVASHRHLRPGVGFQSSDWHQCAHSDSGSLHRLRVLHLRGRHEGSSVDRRGADGVHAAVHLPRGHPGHVQRGRSLGGLPAESRVRTHRAARLPPGPVRPAHVLGVHARPFLLAERELRPEPGHDAAVPRAAGHRQGQEGGGLLRAGMPASVRRVHVLWPAHLCLLPRLRPRHHQAGARQGPGAPTAGHGHPRHVPRAARTLRGRRLQRGAELAVHGAQLDGGRGGGGLLAAAVQDAAERGERQHGHAAGGGGVRRGVRRPGLRRGEARRRPPAVRQPQLYLRRPRARRLRGGCLHALGQRHGLPGGRGRGAVLHGVAGAERAARHRPGRPALPGEARVRPGVHLLVQRHHAARRPRAAIADVAVPGVVPLVPRDRRGRVPGGGHRRVAPLPLRGRRRQEAFLARHPPIPAPAPQGGDRLRQRNQRIHVMTPALRISPINTSPSLSVSVVVVESIYQLIGANYHHDVVVDVGDVGLLDTLSLEAYCNYDWG